MPLGLPHHCCQAICALQAELERDTETLKKEVIDIRLLAQRDIVLDPQAEMLEVSPLPHNQTAEHTRLAHDWPKRALTCLHMSACLFVCVCVVMESGVLGSQALWHAAVLLQGMNHPGKWGGNDMCESTIDMACIVHSSVEHLCGNAMSCRPGQANSPFALTAFVTLVLLLYLCLHAGHSLHL